MFIYPNNRNVMRSGRLTIAEHKKLATFTSVLISVYKRVRKKKPAKNNAVNKDSVFAKASSDKKEARISSGSTDGYEGLFEPFKRKLLRINFFYNSLYIYCIRIDMFIFHKIIK